jgi:hypothetical protein
MKTYQILFFSVFILILVSCGNSTQKSETKSTTEIKQTNAPELNLVDSNFNDFIEKFSSDSLFQISRTKFPLKVTWEDSDNNKGESFQELSNFEVIDFRIMKSNEKSDNWEQKRIIAADNQSAKIEIQGVDNGILVYYLFERTNGVWMLTEINDKSN